MCSPLKFSRRFGGSCRLNQHEARSKQSSSFMFGSFVDSEDVERRIPPKRRFNSQRTTRHYIPPYHTLRRYNYIIYLAFFFWNENFLPLGGGPSLQAIWNSPFFLSTTTWYECVFTAQIIPGSAAEFRCQQDVSSKIIRSVWLKLTVTNHISHSPPICQCLSTELIVQVVVSWDEFKSCSAAQLLAYTKLLQIYYSA
jgi:hypothetical protein